MQKKNAGIVLQNFIVAAAVQPILIIFTEVLQMPMTSDVNYRRNGLNVPL